MAAFALVVTLLVLLLIFAGALMSWHLYKNAFVQTRILKDLRHQLAIVLDEREPRQREQLASIRDELAKQNQSHAASS